ncbi:MAG TPA: acyl carrier protein [Candidatus Dormibacteraeota bacterium]|nr:acyl carrier protein [Candidatus Dormibacteraeota bacterium]
MTLHDRVQDIVRTLFGDEEIVLDGSTVPADVPGWDSLAQVNVIFAVEEAFGIELGGDELSRFTTIGELESRIAAKLSEQGRDREAAT